MFIKIIGNMISHLFVFAFLLRRHFLPNSMRVPSFQRTLTIYPGSVPLSCSSDDDSSQSNPLPDSEQNIDMESVVMYVDMDTLMSMNKLPRKPRRPEEIIADSFEGFLRGQFESILKHECASNREFGVIGFESFLDWRQRMGVILTRQEILDIFHSVVGETEYCSLMEFIQINEIIDENNMKGFGEH